MGVPPGRPNLRGQRDSVVGGRTSLVRGGRDVRRDLRELPVHTWRLQPDVERQQAPARGERRRHPCRVEVPVGARTVHAAEVDAERAVRRRAPGVQCGGRRRRAGIEAVAGEDATPGGLVRRRPARRQQDEQDRCEDPQPAHGAQDAGRLLAKRKQSSNPNLIRRSRTRFASFELPRPPEKLATLVRFANQGRGPIRNQFRSWASSLSSRSTSPSVL